MRREGGAEAVAPFTMPTAELERYKKGTKLPTIQLVAEHGNNVFTVRPTRAGVRTSALPQPCSTAAHRTHVANSAPAAQSDASDGGVECAERSGHGRKLR